MPQAKRLGVGFIGSGFVTRFHLRSWVGVRDAYMSAERETTLAFPPPDLEGFVPAVASGGWNPRRRR